MCVVGLDSEIRYYIIAGDSNEDFHLDQFSGKLSVSRGLDYERVKSYTLTIQVLPFYSHFTITCVICQNINYLFIRLL